MVLKVLCATKADVFSLKSIKRNVIAMLAYVSVMHFIWIFTLTFALVFLSKEELLYVCVCVYRCCLLSHCILYRSKCIQTAFAQKSPTPSSLYARVRSLKRRLHFIWSNKIKYPREMKSECHLWKTHSQRVVWEFEAWVKLNRFNIKFIDTFVLCTFTR